VRALLTLVIAAGLALAGGGVPTDHRRPESSQLQPVGPAVAMVAAPRRASPGTDLRFGPFVPPRATPLAPPPPQPVALSSVTVADVATAVAPAPVARGPPRS
jgi:hypothetical protein